ncbi:putative metalloprotease [Helicobacter cinaedi]|uniref:Endoribonuclease YbeY n=1 Tax=Helicobacter cinaedi TaxID=213 RepID=A0A377JX24_9HELI|nr:rRNA maturation RNase YbeY [Helicobacter cinaedi]STP11785.1 putative metalloprotease [Helicobacter cinaedi]
MQTQYTKSSPMPRLDIDENSPYKQQLEKLLLEILNLGLIKGDFSHCNLEVVFVDSKTMREINRTHRGKDSTTDVLSFPLECDFDFQSLDDTAPFERLLGSIVINTELAKAMSESYNHTLIDEISLLFIHGFLHILGYDHEVDNGEQRALEQCIIESIGLKQSLIVRVQGD